MDREQVTVITGATRGIGRATAERLAREGHRVIGIARKPDPAGFPGRFLAADLSEPEATGRVFDTIAREEPVTALINNVGLVRPQPLGSVRLGDLETVFDLNLRPALQGAQAFLSSMKSRGWGRIVNISSIVTLGIRGRTSYAAAKTALISFTRTWALELAGTGITVNAVAPGPIETELFRENNPPGSEGEKLFLSMVPMGRVGRPEEIAAAVAFFLSEEAGYITGQTLYVDGGASIGKAGV